MMRRARLCELFALFPLFELNLSSWSYPLLLSASWYSGVAFLKMVSVEDTFESRLFILSGIFLMMVGGWLLCLLTYSGLLFGFMNGEYDPVDRFIVMSRKLIDVLLASIVIRKLLLAKIVHIFFLMSSICRAVLLQQIARPSSLYSPILMPRSCSCDKRYSPTSSCLCPVKATHGHIKVRVTT